MNKLLSIAIMGFLLLSVSAVSTVSAAGADDVGFDNSRNRVSDDSPGSDDSTSSGGPFSTPTDERNGASKPEDDSSMSDDSTSAGGPFSTPTDERNGASKPEDDSGVSDDSSSDDSDDSMSAGGSFSTATDRRRGADKPEDNSGVNDDNGVDRRRGADKPEDDTMRISNSHNSGFEGIWSLDGQGANWVGVTVSGNKIIMLKYEPEHLSSALAGSLVGNVAFLGFSVDASSFEATLTLTSSTTAILKVISCNPKSGLTCSFSDDDSFGLTKVFE